MIAADFVARVSAALGSRAEVRVRLCGGRWYVLVATAGDVVTMGAVGRSLDEACDRIAGALLEVPS